MSKPTLALRASVGAPVVEKNTRRGPPQRGTTVLPFLLTKMLSRCADLLWPQLELVGLEASSRTARLHGAGKCWA